jgi:disulfide bond formation protein DsbB
MNKHLSFRLLFALAALFSLAIVSSAYFLEYYFQLEPCSLCLLQRYVLWGIVFLLGLGALQNAQGLFRIIYCLGTGILSSVGTALAARHIWLQHLPPTHEIPSCTAGLEKMLAYKPVLEVLKSVLFENQSCAEVDFTLLGFSLSEWTLLYFIALLAFSVTMIWLQIKRRI